VIHLLNKHVQSCRSDLTKFDSVRNTKIRRRYDIESLPVILFIDPNGEEYRIETLVTKADFLKILNTIQLNEWQKSDE
jgi:thioredoxin-related protein